MALRTQPAAGAPVAGKVLSDGLRTGISFLLFVHLFALGLLFFSNFEGGDWDSELLRRMKIVVRPYLYPLWLNRPYHYHLTYAQPLDYDHYVEVAVRPKQSPDESIVRFPDEELGIGLRRQRYEQMAWHFARSAEVQIGDDVLPLTIGAGLIKRTDAQSAQVRLFRQRSLFLDEVRDGTIAKVPDERLYAADVFFLPGYVEPQLNKIGQARDVAPVTGSAGGAAKPPAKNEDGKGAAGVNDKSAPVPRLLLPERGGGRPTLIPPGSSPNGK